MAYETMSAYVEFKRTARVVRKFQKRAARELEYGVEP